MVLRSQQISKAAVLGDANEVLNAIRKLKRRAHLCASSAPAVAGLSPRAVALHPEMPRAARRTRAAPSGPERSRATPSDLERPRASRSGLHPVRARSTTLTALT